MNRILVTGGAGYVGSHSCKALAQAGYEPVVYDSLLGGHRQAQKWGPLEIGDLRDKRRLLEVFEKYRPAAVLHFAGLIAAGESVHKPSWYYDNNLAASLVLLEVMQERGVERLVFSSSAAVYGVPEALPISETHRLAPINPYGRSKFMVEQILADFDAAYGIRSASLRYFNAAGADPQGELGECHAPETHLIPLVAQAALDPRKKVTVFGTDYDTPDGTAVRDYVHVTDLAAAHVGALNYLSNGGLTTAFNLGNGQGFSVRQIIEAAESVCQNTVAFSDAGRRPGDPPILVADSSKATEILKWSPQFTDIRDIVLSAINWERTGRKFPDAGP